MADDADARSMPDLAVLQHCAWVTGRAQQMMMEYGLDPFAALSAEGPPAAAAMIEQAHDYWTDSLALWHRLIDPANAPPVPPRSEGEARDRRFGAAAWRDDPWFDWVRRSYTLATDRMLRSVDALDGVADPHRERLRFAVRAMADAISPSNFPATHPEVVARTIATGGQNLLDGLQNLLADLAQGQITHSNGGFEVGRNLATTPGKVLRRTPLYELIQYAPATDTVLATPLVIFPPWINRFYILDLGPEKSFIRWAVAQGITVFVVSWRSADAAMKDIDWDDYVAAQVEAVETIRALCDVPAVHAIGYCVAGTTLASTLALLAARGEGDRIDSATFLATQVDFSAAGDLGLFVDDDQLAMIAALSAQGFLDGRYMAATFNLLRGRDLVWTYVTNHYLLGADHVPFDLLHWNGDTTNLPARWHRSYLTNLYRDNLLVRPGALSVAGVPIDLGRITTPCYVQAGRDDHIAPAESVWKITEHVRGPVRFVLAGAGHIAGVVNPPDAGKYQYWTHDGSAPSLDAFVAGARETKGSWWPDWRAWLAGHGDGEVTATGARVPGEGALPALGDAPGDYVRAP